MCFVLSNNNIISVLDHRRDIYLLLIGWQGSIKLRLCVTAFLTSALSIIFVSAHLDINYHLRYLQLKAAVIDFIWATWGQLNKLNI